MEEVKAAKKDPNDFPLTELTKDLHLYPDLHGRSHLPICMAPHMIDIDIARLL